MNRKVVGVASAVVALVLTGFGTLGPASGAGKVEPITRTCEGFTELETHDGFQHPEPTCVETEFGEVSEQSKNPQLLIVDAPEKVRANEPFTIDVSTRNLVRDRFLKAADGGYYLESGTLNEQGLTRGHFHTACRQITDENNAPTPDRNNIFIATEDGGGGASPDTVSVKIANGLPAVGTFQCAAWAGDGSHRVPLMSFANQIPAFDTVRIEVKGAMAKGQDKRSKEDKDKSGD
jgi:hypothetical protein